MFRIYSRYKDYPEKDWIDDKEEASNYQEQIDNTYDIIGKFKIGHIKITSMSHMCANYNEYVDEPYLIILEWNKHLKEFYFFSKILGVIEMLNKIIPVQEIP